VESETAEIRFEDETRLLLEGGRVLRKRGEVDPPLGWCSDAYGSKRPTTTVALVFEGHLPHEFVSVLVPVGTDNGSDDGIANAIGRIQAMHQGHVDV
jgi:hypothetical protein